MPDYTGQPVTVIEWSTIPEYGDDQQQCARERFAEAMTALDVALLAGGQVVGFQASGSNPTWYTVLVRRTVRTSGRWK